MATDSRLSRSRPGRGRPTGKLSFMQQLRSNVTSVRQFLLIAGGGAFFFGAILWIFVRDLAGSALIVMGIGAAILLVDASISWRKIGRVLLGRRGKYGFNTVLIVLAFLAVAIVVNFFLWFLTGRPSPPGWVRIDTTATKQFLLSEQARAVLDNMSEPVRATVFFVTQRPEEQAAWQKTQDLLSEFKRRSQGKFDFRRVDPEFEPNVASSYGVTQHPSIALEGMDSRRIEVVTGLSPRQTTSVFDEQNITTGLLVVNRVRQKQVLFVTGHGEREVTNFEENTKGFSRAAEALLRDNYSVASVTLQEIGPAVFSDEADPTRASDDPEQSLPAALVFAGPQSDLLEGEAAILVEYLRKGGNALFMLEPNPPPSFLEVVGVYGITVGQHQLVDTASYVAPNPLFLQVKRSNQQFSPTHRITAPIDVTYMPGTAFIGRTITEDTVPLTEDGQPTIDLEILATTTLNSWEESDPESIGFDVNKDVQGPLPVAVAVEAVAPIGLQPVKRNDGTLVKTNMVIVGDTDFASNSFFSSAKNGDLIANSVNWLAKDYELISIRPKTKVFRELVLTTRERDFVRWTGWLLMPVLIGATGVVMWWRRR
ncbi:MAG: GldG family protein [Chloroflexi bacterium]|nr:GldG family protein [Chloroflexota bacterium]